MKKHVYSLMMVLALVVLAGTSAWAQVPDGSALNPYYHVNGSTHTLTVTANAASTFSWTSDATTGGGTPDLTTFSGTATNQATITWSEDAAGLYHFDVTETDQTVACKQTVRRVYVAVIAFDIYAYYSTSDGSNSTSIEGTAAMQACGAGTVANYANDGGTAFDQLVNIETSGTAGDLSTQTGTSPMTQRYISLALTWATGGYGTFTAPTVGSIQFDYTVSLTDADGTFETFNVETTASGTTTADGDGSSPWIIPIEYNAQWGIADVTATVTITNARLYSGAAAGGTLLGTELNSNETAAGTATPNQNTTATQTIYSAPATSVITVAP